MENLDTHLVRLQEKVQLLVKRNQLLLKENIQLKKENEAFCSAIEKKDDQLYLLQQQLDLLKLNHAGLQDDDKKELQKRIDGYLKEVEKCLSILNE